MGWQFWIDRGGTFTDIVAVAPDGTLKTHKLLSENPERYRDAALAGIKLILGLAPHEPIAHGQIDVIKMGTTVATNALLERKGARTLLVVNRGFADLLQIGTQARPRLFDLDIRLPQQLYTAVFETCARVTAHGVEVQGVDAATALDAFRAARAGQIESCAIALIHAWEFPAHERELAELARQAGFEQVSVSHEVSPLLGLAPRAATTVVDAYLSPVLRRYVEELAAEVGGARVLFMQSNGGLVDAAGFQGKDAILSGPAGGIVGAARTAAQVGLSHIIGFDMGGTSTDVALYAGTFERTFDAEIAGVRVRAPMLAIHSVAAGGGSILCYDGARFRVGPESAGADPGPACYRRGGPLTVTDANVCVGKIQPAHFPHIFGPSGDLAIDAAVVHERFASLAARIACSGGAAALDARAIAAGFLRVAVSHMANAIKQVSLEKGHDVGDFALQCFGGAAGQHACLVAEELGMQSILIHPLAGVLSAYGMGLAAQSLQRERAIERAFSCEVMPHLADIADRLESEARSALIKHGRPAENIRVIREAHLQYAGADTALPVPLTSWSEMGAAFTRAHERRFGFATPERGVRVALISVEVTALGRRPEDPVRRRRSIGQAQPIDEVDLFTGGKLQRAPVYVRAALCPADVIDGPALITEDIATTVIEPGWRAEVNTFGHLRLLRTAVQAERGKTDLRRVDPVLLELFNNIFMNVAEQMGAVLQNTSTSVNIRERLDFSCAVFDCTGQLIANAPHVPVHLGAMGESVQTVIRSRGAALRPGDVVVLNNPFNGGTHLPDITVVTPVFDDHGAILFFAGNRGHHADIGGTTPGSTPPHSTRLVEEGVVIDDFLLVAGGQFRETEFRALLTGARYPARSPDTNIADIKAQIAANTRGVSELKKIVAKYGSNVVTAYMRHIMDNGEESVRDAIVHLNDASFDYVMDDGSPLRVAVRIDREARAATIDFTGTGPQHDGNFNAPPAVTRAVVLYALRCLVAKDIPLNDGCLRPITIVVPAGTFLAPRPGSAVVAGNTEVSQAVCNALLSAFGVCAASQATMNNLLFGDEHRQYYETICGGAGAGPGFHGASAVHTHMTNTRITDAEVLELRYPVSLEAFAIRRGSGGEGEYRGGDGAVRRLRFNEPMTAVMVASRRNVAPHGLAGGASGARGRQWIERADGAIEPLGPIDQKELCAGDQLVVETPGGGGYGERNG